MDWLIKWFVQCVFTTMDIKEVFLVGTKVRNAKLQEWHKIGRQYI